MKRFLPILLLFLCLASSSKAQQLSTLASEQFVPEKEMKARLLQMLANFMPYVVNQYQEMPANRAGEGCATFKSRNTGKANEDGVRTNADLSMVCAFLSRYGRNEVKLPQGITWQQIDTMARRTLVYAYSTHKACRLADCVDGKHWGSVSLKDHTWESSLWAMSVAYSAFFQWKELTDAQRHNIYSLLKAECQYELERDIPTGFKGDTKAEENGWEACVLAATLGLFPDDADAPKWFERLRLFAINSYSHADDAKNTEVVDPEHDNQTVAQLFRGSNLYDDWTLQNHNFFHTSYQNVVVQELGEAALALQLFQQSTGRQRWHTRALMHNNLNVQRKVLNWLALADGELAMPNGNDWSLFLYDQITSFTTNATFLRDADALMLENLAFRMIEARQRTTTDGAWLLRSDIGPRRMGVEAHRVMMTWLMHEMNSTANLQPSTFENFRQRYSAARLFPCQNIVRAYTKDRFTTFSWQPGIKSYTGYFADNNILRNKTVVPFKANNTGNLLGWTIVDGKRTNAVPAVSGRYRLNGDAWTMEGRLLTNDSTLDHHFVLCSTAGNAFIYLDNITAKRDVNVRREEGGLLAISMDPFTQERRRLYTAQGNYDVTGDSLLVFNSPWVNIDQQLGVVAGRWNVPAAQSLVKRNKFDVQALSRKLFSLTQNKALSREIALTVTNDCNKPDSIGVWMFSTKGNTSPLHSTSNVRDKNANNHRDKALLAGQMAFGNKADNNSVLTAKLYTLYNNEAKPYREGTTVAHRFAIYYSNVTAEQTAKLSAATRSLNNCLPEGYAGLLVNDPDGTIHVVVMRLQ